MKGEITTLDNFIGEEDKTERIEIEVPYELPEGWRWVKLGEILTDTQSGFACSKKNEMENGIPHLRPNNIGFNGELDFSYLVHLPEKKIDLTKYSLKKGDILFNNTNSKELVGRASLVKEDLSYGFSNHITKVRVNDDLLVPEWVVLAINYLWLQGHFLKICQKWIGQAGVNTRMLKSTQIPLPSLEEQKRIVARIEELFSKVEEIKRLRKEALEDAKALMPSALHEVFSKADEKGWNWVRLENVLREDRKAINPQEYLDTEFWHLTMDCIESDTGKLLGRTYLRGCEIKSTKYQFNSKHILYGKLRPYLNKVYSVSDGEQGICTTEFIPFVVIDANKNYIAHYLRTKNAVDFAMSNLTGTRQPRTNIDALLGLQIPLPLFEEQKRIVRYLDKIQEKAIALQKLQEETEKEVEELRESILHKAFEGEL